MYVERMRRTLGISEILSKVGDLSNDIKPDEGRDRCNLRSSSSTSGVGDVLDSCSNLSSIERADVCLVACERVDGSSTLFQRAVKYVSIYR